MASVLTRSLFQTVQRLILTMFTFVSTAKKVMVSASTKEDAQHVLTSTLPALDASLSTRQQPFVMNVSPLPLSSTAHVPGKDAQSGKSVKTASPSVLDALTDTPCLMAYASLAEESRIRAPSTGWTADHVHLMITENLGTVSPAPTLPRSLSKMKTLKLLTTSVFSPESKTASIRPGTMNFVMSATPGSSTLNPPAKLAVLIDARLVIWTSAALSVTLRSLS